MSNIKKGYVVERKAFAEIRNESEPQCGEIMIFFSLALTISAVIYVSRKKVSIFSIKIYRSFSHLPVPPLQVVLETWLLQSVPQED